MQCIQRVVVQYATVYPYTTPTYLINCEDLMSVYA
jgi:hypothetical protein